MLNGLVAYYKGFGANGATFVGDVILEGENKGFDSSKLKLNTASSTITNVASANFKIVPVTAATALYGGEWATALTLAPAAEADWSVPLSLWTVCGKKSVVGVNGVPNNDASKPADAGSAFLGYEWTFGTGNSAVPMMCWFGTDKDATDKGKLNLPKFVS
jgi:hypothetical protein